MTSLPPSSSDRERALHAAVAVCLEALEAHPDLAPELADFFAGREALDRLAGPPRPATAPVTVHDPRDRSAAKVELGPGPPALSRPFGDYELLEEIARGGMGIVFKARQVRLDRVVALKTIAAGRLASAEDVERFRVEAQAVASLDHPHIVPIYEVGQHEGRHYFSMKLIEGGSLAAWRGVADTPQAMREAAKLVATVARAVQHAHEHGILHRDLKPANILLAPAFGRGSEDSHAADLRSPRPKAGANWVPYVTDFGLAKQLGGGGDATPTDAIVGTPSYMAPEQTAGRKRLTTAADVYSMGAILYTLLTGRAPFTGDSWAEVVCRVREDEPSRPRLLNPRVSRDLETICLKCLRKEPERRYGSAAALADDLDRWLAGEPISARPVGRLEGLWYWCRRNPVPTAAGLLIFGVIAIAFGVVMQERNDAVEARAQSDVAERGTHAALGKERQARQEADSSRAKAVESRNVARKHQRQAERERAHLALYHAWNLSEVQHKPAHGLLWQARALELARQAEADDLERASRKNLTAWSARFTPLRAVLAHGGYGSEVKAVAFSPDSTIVATACADGTVRLWDAATGAARGKPLGDPARRATDLPPEAGVMHPIERVLHISPPPDRHPVYAIAFSPDGKTLASGGGMSAVKLWDVATGKLRRTLAHKPTTTKAVAFSRDGKTLVTGSLDQAARLWAADTGELRATLKHPGWVEVAIFSPDGKTVLTGCRAADKRKGEARLWDVATGRPLCEPLVHDGDVFCGSFSPDGRLVVTGGGHLLDQDKDGGEVRLWEVPSGKPAAPVMRFAKCVQATAFCPDGRVFLAGAIDGVARVLDVAAGTGYTIRLPGKMWTEGIHVTNLKTGDRFLAVDRYPGLITSAAFSPDGRTFALAGTSGAVVVETVNGRAVGNTLEHPGPLHGVAYSPDGRLLATAGADRTARLWAPATGQPALARSLVFDAPVSRLLFSPDGKTLLVGMADSLAWLHDATTGKVLVPPLDHGSMVTCLAISPDGKNVATGGMGLGVRLWETASGKAVGRPLAHPEHVLDVAFSPDGRTLAVACDHSLRGKGGAQLWDVASRKPRGGLLAHKARVWSLAFSPDGKALLTASADNTAQFWDVATGKAIGEPLRHPREVRLAAFGRDGKTILTGGLDGVARTWDPVTGKALAALHHRGPILALAYSRDGRTIVTASADARAQLWDVATGRARGPALVHDKAVVALALSPDGQTVLTGSTDGTVRLWDAATGQVLGPVLRQAGPIHAVAFSPDGRTYASGGDSKRVEVQVVPASLAGTPAQVVRWAEVVTGLRLDNDRAVRWLEPDSWRQSRQELAKLGGDPLPGEDALAWHQREADECEATEQWFPALWHLRRRLDGEPMNGSLLARVGRAHVRLGQSAEGIEALSLAITHGADGPEVRSDRADAYGRQLKWQQATVDLSEALRQRPGDDKLRRRRATTWAEQGQWDRAQLDLETVATLPRAPVGARVELALVYLARGDLTHYRQECAALLRRYGDSKSGAVIAPILWTVSLDPEGIAGRSLVVSAKGLSLPAELKTYAFLRAAGASLYRAQKHQAAIQRLTEATGVQAQAPATWLLLALAHHRLGAAEARRWQGRATVWLEQARCARPGEASAWERLAWQERLALELLSREAKKALPE
jgi:WD40 repeat protein/Flp pilus assembly protein TadD